MYSDGSSYVAKLNGVIVARSNENYLVLNNTHILLVLL